MKNLKIGLWLRRLLSIFTAAGLLFSAMPNKVNIFAESFSSCLEGVTYTYKIIDGDAVEITSARPDSPGLDVAIPGVLMGYVVKSIGNAAFKETNIRSVRIPNTVETIGEEAFEGCKDLKLVDFSDTPVDDFWESDDFYSFAGADVCGDCDNFTEFDDIQNEPQRQDTRLNRIGREAFSGTGIEEFYISNSVREIGEEAFGECENLESVKFEENSQIEFLHPGAFLGSAIKKIFIYDTDSEIPGKTTYLEKDKFTYNDIDLLIISDVGYRKGHGVFVFNNILELVQGAIFRSASNFSSIYGRFDHLTENPFQYTSPEGVVYSGNKKKLISCNPNFKGEEIRVPEGIEEIQEEAFEKTRVRKIYIPKSVKKIGNKSLDSIDNNGLFLLDGILYNDNGKKLVSFTSDFKGGDVIIPEGVEEICENAFRMSPVERVFIPSSVTTIGKEAFARCLNLTSAVFEENSQLKNIGDGAFSGSKIESIFLPSGVEILPKELFFGCKNLLSIEFAKDSHLVNIENGAFSSSGIKEITIPESVESIGETTFSYCKKLERVNITQASHLKMIGDYAFMCSAIKNILIPRYIERISAGMFYYCSALKTVCFTSDSKLTFIGKEAFRKSGLEYIFIPNKEFLRIEDRAFMNTENLKNIEFANGSGYISLGECVLPEYDFEAEHENIRFEILKNEDIEKSGFYEDGIIYCGYDKKVIKSYNGHFKGQDIRLPNTVKTICEHAFDNSGAKVYISKSSVKEVGNKDLSELGDELNGIDNLVLIDGILYGEYNGRLTKVISCTQNLAGQNIKLPDGIEEICQDAFEESGVGEINIPKSLVKIGRKVLSNLVPVSEESENFLINGIIYNIDKEGRVRLIYSVSNAEEVTIPSYVNEICYGAFYECKNLQSIKFEENSNLEIIGEYAFAATNLESVLIPDTVRVIEASAFRSCGNLKEIKFGTGSQLQKIGEGAFAVTAIENVVIPSRVEFIGEAVFGACDRLLRVALPANLESSIEDAFEKDCDITLDLY